MRGITKYIRHLVRGSPPGELDDPVVRFCRDDGSPIKSSQISQGLATLDRCGYCMSLLPAIEQISMYVKRKGESSAERIFQMTGISPTTQTQAWYSWGRDYPQLEFISHPSKLNDGHWKLKEKASRLQSSQNLLL